MAKILIAGDAIVITSSKTLEEITTLEKYKPEALCLYNEDKEAIFKVGTSPIGSAGKYGVAFNSATRDGGNFACLTLAAPDIEDLVGFVKDKYGLAILNLNKVEAQVDGALTEVNTQMEAIESNIVLL